MRRDRMEWPAESQIARVAALRATRADKLAEARRATPPSLSTHASRISSGRVARLYLYEQTRALEVARASQTPVADNQRR